MQERIYRPDLRAAEVYTRRVLERLVSTKSDEDIEDIVRGAKKEAMKVLLKYESYGPEARWLYTGLRIYKSMIEEVERGLLNAGYHVARLLFALKGPGLVGMGSGLFRAIFEVGLMIDPVTGLPYYPGSSVKGAVRSFAELLLQEACVDPATAGKLLDTLFGSSSSGQASGHVGIVFFSDMVPVGCAKKRCSIFRGLVVNPHYQYRGRVVDDEMQAIPEPVQHVGIEEGTLFSIVVGVRGDESEINQVSDLLRNISSSVDSCNDHSLPRPISVAKQVISEEHSDKAYALLVMVSLLLMETLRTGFAARSTKGYNVFMLGKDAVDTFELRGYRYAKTTRAPATSTTERGPRRGSRRRRGPRARR